MPNSLLLFEPECDRTLLQPVQPTLGKIQGMEEISKIETTACSMPYIATNKRFSVLLKKYIFCYYLNQSQYQINSSVGFAVEATFLVFRNGCFHVPIVYLNFVWSTLSNIKNLLSRQRIIPVKFSFQLS